MNPDGIRQMVFYGNMHPGTVFIDAKPVPNSDKYVVSYKQATCAGSSRFAAAFRLARNRSPMVDCRLE
jgi:hypothetical protein